MNSGERARFEIESVVAPEIQLPIAELDEGDSPVRGNACQVDLVLDGSTMPARAPERVDRARPLRPRKELVDLPPVRVDDFPTRSLHEREVVPLAAGIRRQRLEVRERSRTPACWVEDR